MQPLFTLVSEMRQRVHNFESKKKKSDLTLLFSACVDKQFIFLA